MLAEAFQSYRSDATIRCGVLSGIDGLLERRGVKAPAFYEKLGVGLDVLGNPDLRVAVRGYVELLESAALLSQDETLGLRLGYQQPLSTLGALSDLCLAAPDVESAIRSGTIHLPMHQEGARLELTVERSLAVLSYSVLDAGLLEYRQDAELSIAKLVRFARSIAGRSDWAPTAVYFEHPAPRDVSAYRRLFGAPVYFSQEKNGIAFPKELLRWRIGAGMPRIMSAAVDSIVPPPNKVQLDLASELRLHVIRALRRGHTSIDDCAAAFGLSRRTFQRRLAAADVIFEELVEGTRHELARHYLKQTHLSFTEIGFLLGYAELSNFSRAFKRWSGSSPQEFRRGQ